MTEAEEQPALTTRAKQVVRALLRRTGYDLVRYPPPEEPEFPVDFDEATKRTIRAVRAFTMTSDERIFALCEAVRHVARHGIPGDIVECGVWRGGSMMAAARTLMEAGETSRRLYLFDTFAGMPPPSGHDRCHDQRRAEELLADADPSVEDSIWCVASLDDVQQAMSSVGYPHENVRYVQGRVEETVPAQAPERIALLRLDTDWYESTKHELEHLMPRMSPGAVVIIDDYGWWQGARKAVDEYWREASLNVMLHRVDHTARIADLPV